MPSDVELYQRTYSTLLRSRGETKLRILGVVAHRDRVLVASVRRCGGSRPRRVLVRHAAAPREHLPGPRRDHGPGGRAVRRPSACHCTTGPTTEAPARRRQWHQGPDGQWGVLLSSTSDVDDLIPTLVAYQIEWNKLRRKLRAIGWPRPQGLPGAAECARVLGGSVDDWERLQEAWGTAFARRLGEVAETNLLLRVRMLGGSQVSYARLTRRWWAPVAHTMRDHGIGRDAPIYFVSSNTHSLVNLLSGDARAREADLVEWVERAGPRDLQRRARRLPRGAHRRLVEQLPVLPGPRAGDSEPGAADAPLRRGRRAGSCISTPSRACASPRR